jgi:hypothetical protein
MLSFRERRKVEKLKKNKGTSNEPRSNQTHGEGGDIHQQGEVTGSDSEVSQPTLHVFAAPEL